MASVDARSGDVGLFSLPRPRELRRLGRVSGPIAMTAARPGAGGRGEPDDVLPTDPPPA